MKKAFFLFFVLAIACATYAQRVIRSTQSVIRNSQGVIKSGERVNVDKVKYRITYAGKIVRDTLNIPYKYIESEMRLDIGNKVTRFYDHTKEVRDSIIHAGMLSGSYDFNNLPKGGSIAWEYYRNYPADGQSTFLESVVTTDYQCVEQVETPSWQLLPDSSATIMGYNCQLAVARFKGRTWYAWYAEDLPLSEGPWKLCGLPGLVLRAYDQSRQYIFDGVGMANINGNADITFNKKVRENITQKDLREAKEKIDFTSLLDRVSPSDKVTVKSVSADGTTSTNTNDVKRMLKDFTRKKKINPIELGQ